MNLLNKLISSIRQAAIYNPDFQVAPACILWPDHDRQWESAIVSLQAEMPELLVLGDYDPTRKTGPAIWLRCVLGGQIPKIPMSSKYPFIIYLPGVSRQDLRAIEDCPAHLKPLAELQYRGVIWSQINAKDWTIMAYMVSEQGGLGLDVAKDSETKMAMQRSLVRLLDEDVDFLRGKLLDADFFNGLLSGGDHVREVLMWLDQGESYKNSRTTETWSAFVARCVSQLEYNPELDGHLEGCSRLAQQQGYWRSIWDRFREAPTRYPNIPIHIRLCSPPTKLNEPGTVDFNFSGWPQWVDIQEERLKNLLKKVAKLPTPKSREQIIELEREFASCRDTVWAEIGHGQDELYT
jgi:hypothetical protein